MSYEYMQGLSAFGGMVEECGSGCSNPTPRPVRVGNLQGLTRQRRILEGAGCIFKCQGDVNYFCCPKGTEAQKLLTGAPGPGAPGPGAPGPGVPSPGAFTPGAAILDEAAVTEDTIMDELPEGTVTDEFVAVQSVENGSSAGTIIVLGLLGVGIFAVAGYFLWWRPEDEEETEDETEE